MLLNNRVIWNNSGTLRDISVEMNDLFAEAKVIPFVAATDKLYLGSELPFNHRYFKFSALNAVASAPSVEIWSGSQWNPAVDVLDLTKGFTQDGIIQWTTDRNRSWGIEDSTENLADLATLKIYGLYWVRLSFAANFTITTALQYIGHKFASDAQLAAQWPDLGRAAVMAAHTAGKTNWNDQHVLAAEEIIVWLRKENVIKKPEQIFGFELFQNAAVHKAAEIIFSAFGEKKEDERELASKKFEKAMNQRSSPWIDKNGDGQLEGQERVVSTSFRRV